MNIDLIPNNITVNLFTITNNATNNVSVDMIIFATHNNTIGSIMFLLGRSIIRIESIISNDDSIVSKQNDGGFTSNYGTPVRF